MAETMQLPLIVWEPNVVAIITRMQREELKLAWVHNAMYDILSSKSYRWNWAIAIMGFFVGIIAFIMVAINNSIFQTVAGIINGIVGLTIGFLTKQSERLNLETDAENHRRTAAMHTALFEDIEYMKTHPSQTADKYLFHIRATSQSIRENAANLYVYDEVYVNFKAECIARNIQDQDAFAQLASLAGSLSDPPPESRVIEQKRDKQDDDGKVQSNETRKKGYDPRRLAYELDRLAS